MRSQEPWPQKRLFIINALHSLLFVLSKNEIRMRQQSRITKTVSQITVFIFSNKVNLYIYIYMYIFFLKGFWSEFERSKESSLFSFKAFSSLNAVACSKWNHCGLFHSRSKKYLSLFLAVCHITVNVDRTSSFNVAFKLERSHQLTAFLEVGRKKNHGQADSWASFRISHSSVARETIRR